MQMICIGVCICWHFLTKVIVLFDNSKNIIDNWMANISARPFQGVSKCSHIVWFANISEICAMILHACFITAAAIFYIFIVCYQTKSSLVKVRTNFFFERSVYISPSCTALEITQISKIRCAALKLRKVYEVKMANMVLQLIKTISRLRWLQ